MSLSQIASTIDQQRSEADQRFRDHAAQVETNLTGQTEAQTRRTLRRRTSASPPRQGSHDSGNSDLLKTQRTAAWASSLESEQLQNITEEESELIDDENTRHGTDPSSFPSGIFDHSYNYERGLRRPQMLDTSANVVATLFNDLGGATLQLIEDVAKISRRATSILLNTSWTAGKATIQALPYMGVALLGLLITALAAMFLLSIFCSLFRRTICDPLSSSTLQATLQNYCGECINSFHTLPEYLDPEQHVDMSFVPKAIGDLRRQLQDVEKRIDSKLDAKYSLFSLSVEELKERQRDIETHLSKLERQSARSSGPSSLGDRVNYFAPGSGAIINPIKSSPTLQRPPNNFWRSWQLITGRVNYVSNPPAAALEAWADLGDCWCSAGGEDIRLDVKMGYLIYPTHIAIEHIPTSASPDPGTAPREVEIWASFAHLSADEFAEKGIWNLVGSNSIATGMGKVGTVLYDARPDVYHIQTFRLDVNQGAMMHSTNEVTVRVVSNQGADRTCLYRVKLYGQPVVPHPTPVGISG